MAPSRTTFISFGRSMAPGQNRVVCPIREPVVAERATVAAFLAVFLRGHSYECVSKANGITARPFVKLFSQEYQLVGAPARPRSRRVPPKRFLLGRLAWLGRFNRRPQSSTDLFGTGLTIATPLRVWPACIKQIAARAGPGGDDHRVPEGKPTEVLNLAASLQQSGIDGNGSIESMMRLAAGVATPPRSPSDHVQTDSCW